jgi:hypothetical protein
VIGFDDETAAGIEEAFLRAVMNERDSIVGHLHRFRLVLYGLLLEGSFPATVLVVRCFDTRRKAVGEVRFDIWTAFFHEGRPYLPHVAAGIVDINIMEGADWVWEEV